MIGVTSYAAKVDAPTPDLEEIAWVQQDFVNSLYTTRCSRDALKNHRDNIPGLVNRDVYVQGLITPIRQTTDRKSVV